MHPFYEKVKNILSQYRINIQGLDNKRHAYEFEGGEEFFKYFEQEIVEKGNFKAVVFLDKSSSMMKLNFEIKATLELLCDKTLEPYTEEFEIEEMYIYKFGDRKEIVSEDVEIIPFGEVDINVAQNLLDYICLAVPMKKVHPKYRVDSDDMPELVYSDTKEEIKPKNEEVDSRWAALQKLNFKK